MERDELQSRKAEAFRLSLISAQEILTAAIELLEIECTHPAEDREDISTMGHPGRWRCKVCNHIHEPQSAAEQEESDG